uniref:Uncharacterized protein n=1 Tax=Knipowitschia caucasica TaxID=637954 RepID=A0AAV2JSY0_KNICA
MEKAHKVISYPNQEDLEDIGKGFGRLAGHKAFDKAMRMTIFHRHCPQEMKDKKQVAETGSQLKFLLH